MKYFLIYFLILLSISSPLFGKAVEQSSFNFQFNSESLMTGDIYYAFKTHTKEDLKKNLPKILLLDSIGITKNKEFEFIVMKSVYVLKREVGFFDHKTMSNKKLIQALFKTNDIKKESENSFKVKTPDYSFLLKVFYDSDDISTLDTSKIVRAVTAAKKMDLLSESASSIILKELTTPQNGSVNISIHIPLKERRTLVIDYQLFAIKKNATKKNLKEKFIQNVIHSKEVFEKFKQEKGLP